MRPPCRSGRMVGEVAAAHGHGGANFRPHVPNPVPGDTMLGTALLTASALVAFAANSVLCRLALGGGSIDAASFALVRLGSGALTLAVIQAARRGRRPANRGWVPPLMLFAYVAAFSFAYTLVSAGTGALLLFGAVQATMILVALRSGERLTLAEGAGLAFALGGLTYLVLPGLSAPSPAGSALMLAAGVAWGVYSLRGRSSRDPLADTARNFTVATAPALIVSLARLGHAHADARGALLAVCSGALTSGIGYVIWFAALRGLTAIPAATAQLAVPVLAAAGGVVFLSEELTPRFAVAAAAVVGGIGIAIAGRARRGVRSRTRFFGFPHERSAPEKSLSRSWTSRFFGGRRDGPPRGG